MVDVQKQFPLLGRDWMTLLNFDLISLMTQATPVHQMTADVKLGLLEEFAEVFRDELGVKSCDSISVLSFVFAGTPQ